MEPSYDPDWEPDEDDEPSDDDLEAIEDEDDEFNEGMEELMQHYTAETTEFNEASEEFTEKYGFVHNCRCAQDWEEGNLGVVSVCYIGMVTDALDALEGKVVELKNAKRELAGLRIKLADSSG